MAAATAASNFHHVAVPSKVKPIIINGRHLSQDERDMDFTPEVHLDFKQAPDVLMMKDLGLPEDNGVSPVAVSQPFQLFAPAAIDRMRDEALAPEVMENCKFSSNIAACQLRGYANRYAHFVRDAWKHPKTLAIISKVAGIELIPEMDYEIGNVNVSVKSEEQTKQELALVSKQQQAFAEDEGIAGCPWEDDKPVVGWHEDSYPFVCVLMLSDCTNMVGGETALKKGDGETLKVRGPAMGCAVVMQGRYITHQALRALGAQERITMVTSFRPKDPTVKDDSVLTTVRPISNLSELFFEFGEYRLAMLEERIRQKLTNIRDRARLGKPFAIADFKAFLEEQQKFLEHTGKEIVG
ncbi:MAG: hypothetical protein Q9162_007393 [Coniocarpon cinnabarinum]